MFLNWNFYEQRSYLFCRNCFLDVDIHDVSGYTVATQYLQNLEISSAEMTQYLSNIKLSGSNCITKKYRVPYFNHALRDATLIKYMDRPERFKDLSFIQYIR